jgi:hypothetical protein
VASLGFDLDGLQRDGLLVIIAFPVEAAEIIETGEFDFGPLSLLLDNASRARQHRGAVRGVRGTGGRAG